MSNYIVRNIDTELLLWKENPNRKPIILRGARQVGKSSSVKQFALSFSHYLEINLDENPRISELFVKHTSPQQLCVELEVVFNIPIIPGKTLLFIDEIQISKEAIQFLRYFYEKFPELHVIAAGSLLEFALEELPSFGVGRVRSLFVYPFSFFEFLNALNEHKLLNAIQSAGPTQPLSDLVHKKCLELLQTFAIIGGMPEVVRTYANTKNLQACQEILDDITTSYFDDFAKYNKHVPAERIRAVFSSVIQQMGQKFSYSSPNLEFNSKQVKECLSLLERSGLIYSVVHSSGNGIPLAAEMNPKHKKYLIFDTGLYQRFLRLDLTELFLNQQQFIQINKGALAELFVGLELIKGAQSNTRYELYYWQREKKGSQSEVDYLIQRGTQIIPIEVKSGTRGAMQSMHQFLNEKNYKLGIRTSLESFSQFDNIQVIPIYAIATR